ncbi:DnaD domain protein [Lactobacillus acetotolerans]|uniref:DnaD domain protein n=1 Tax=Lactobacillus acetotolerans TaxID=1600 RepID=UPI0019D01EC2|nr:DnaD domain protein [Lactobacillus acetotolerans]MBN7276364.1 chromosome replication initiation protein [Lactobacillus acetotolerans]
MFETSDPKQPFFVTNKVVLFPNDIRILIKLYQPLVGATAIALYLTLVEDFNADAILSDAKGIYSLQEQLDCSLKDLFKALHKLEAVGLIKTVLIKNEIMGQVITFRLLRVPTSSEFFSTPLLASLLKEKVGVTTFHNLSHTFARENKKKENQVNGNKSGRDVSASFIDVFRLPGQEAISPSLDVQEAANENQTHSVAKASVNEHDSIDWNFMKQQFAIYQIPIDEIDKKREQIRGVMQTYGLSEQEFVDEALPCLHGSYELDMRLIEHTIAENYRLDGTRKRVKQEIHNDKEKKTPANIEDLNSKQQEIYQAAMSKSPSEFLYKLKKEKGGFVYASENQILNNLHNQYGLPSDLINVLVYTCLSFKPGLSSSLAYSIANDWLQHGVATASQALQYVAKRRGNIGGHKQKRYYTNKRVEKGTDWSKKKSKVDKNVSSAQLKNFFKNLEDKNGMK